MKEANRKDQRWSQEPEPAGAVFPDTIEGMGVASKGGELPVFSTFQTII